MPFPSKKRARRRCVLCGVAELTPTLRGRFLLTPDHSGRGPICPARRGCDDRQRQLSFDALAVAP